MDVLIKMVAEAMMNKEDEYIAPHCQHLEDAWNNRPPAVPITEGSMSKGGVNPPNISTLRPIPPEGSGGKKRKHIQMHHKDGPILKCDGNCNLHVGEVKEIKVVGGQFDETFNYCETAINEDIKRGFKVYILANKKCQCPTGHDGAY